MAFKKTFWSDKLEEKLYANQPLIDVVRADFEGEAKFGNMVKVYTYESAVTVQDYDGVTPVPAQKLAPSEVTLLIDQAKTFRIRTDRVDELQGDPMAIDKFAKTAMFEVGQLIESKIYAHKADLTNNLDLSGQGPMDATNAVSIIEKLEVLLDDENVDTDRFLYVPNAIKSILRQANYLNVTPVTNSETGGTREVARWGNFEVISSSNLVANGGVYEILFGSKDAIRFVGALEELEYGKVEGLFGKAIFGLYVYGSAVFNSKKGGTLTIDAA